MFLSFEVLQLNYQVKQFFYVKSFLQNALLLARRVLACFVVFLVNAPQIDLVESFVELFGHLLQAPLNCNKHLFVSNQSVVLVPECHPFLIVPELFHTLH